MKKIIFFLLLFGIINCSTITYKENVDFSPNVEIGCAEYTGINWEKCMIKLLRNKESIYSEPPVTIDTNEKFRINDREIVVKQKTCFGTNVFCYYHYDRRYDPTLSYKIQNHPITKIIIFTIGLAIGLNV